MTVGMEQVLDKLVADIQDLADKPFSIGGFSDEMPLESDVYWGESPTFTGIESYPLIEVAPVLSEPAGGTTQKVNRELTIRVTLLYDARAFFDETETAEATASREVVRTMDSIEKYLEQTASTTLDGLARKAEVGATDYAPALPRGIVNVRSASATINVQIERPRSN